MGNVNFHTYVIFPHTLRTSWSFSTFKRFRLLSNFYVLKCIPHRIITLVETVPYRGFPSCALRLLFFMRLRFTSFILVLESLALLFPLRVLHSFSSCPPPACFLASYTIRYYCGFCNRSKIKIRDSEVIKTQKVR